MVEFCCIVTDTQDNPIYHTHISIENELRVGPELILQGVMASAVEAGVDLSQAHVLTVEYMMVFTKELREAVALSQAMARPPAGSVH